jgi:hypothetical protein
MTGPESRPEEFLTQIMAKRGKVLDAACRETVYFFVL